MGGFFDSEPLDKDLLIIDKHKPIGTYPTATSKSFAGTFFLGGILLSYGIGKMIRKKFY